MGTHSLSTSMSPPSVIHSEGPVLVSGFTGATPSSVESHLPSQSRAVQSERSTATILPSDAMPNFNTPRNEAAHYDHETISLLLKVMREAGYRDRKLQKKSLKDVLWMPLSLQRSITG